MNVKNSVRISCFASNPCACHGNETNRNNNRFWSYYNRFRRREVDPSRYSLPAFSIDAAGRFLNIFHFEYLMVSIRSLLTFEEKHLISVVVLYLTNSVAFS